MRKLHAGEAPLGTDQSCATESAFARVQPRFSRDARQQRAPDLLRRYEIPYGWNSSPCRILIGAVDVAPTYRDDAVQASVGWPLVEFNLQSGNALVILSGIFGPEPDGDRTWCRVVEFAVEFGISASCDPLVPAERRGA